MKRTAQCLTILLSLTALARADNIWTGAADKPDSWLKSEVTIQGMDKTEFTVESRGSQATRPRDRVQRIEVTGEPAFNKSEESFIAGKPEDAVDGYLRTARSYFKDAKKKWLASYAALRLAKAADKANRVDAAVNAYAYLSLIDPENADTYKPRLPGSTSPAVDTAANDLKALMPSVTDKAARLRLADILVRLQTLRGDKAAIAEASKIMEEASRGAEDASGQALLQVRAAQKLLSENKFREAIAQIEANRAAIIGQDNQVEALFVLAQANRSLLAPGDKTGSIDAALKFMQVVAETGEAADAPHKLESLMAAAALTEAGGDLADALTLYAQIATDYENSPAGAEAQKNAKRLADAMPKKD